MVFVRRDLEMLYVKYIVILGVLQEEEKTQTVFCTLRTFFRRHPTHFSTQPPLRIILVPPLVPLRIS